MGSTLMNRRLDAAYIGVSFEKPSNCFVFLAVTLTSRIHGRFKLHQFFTPYIVHVAMPAYQQIRYVGFKQVLGVSSNIGRFGNAGGVPHKQVELPSSATALHERAHRCLDR
ncbi:hypothetical protein ACT91Q_10770 [Brevibacillus thermoruber]|uniref:hypothetical protein n=1 Tax=Brevibacillus thermoruber TaxID=33942 RepID=UPI0040424520